MAPSGAARPRRSGFARRPTAGASPVSSARATGAEGGRATVPRHPLRDAVQQRAAAHRAEPRMGVHWPRWWVQVARDPIGVEGRVLDRASQRVTPEAGARVEPAPAICSGEA